MKKTRVTKKKPSGSYHHGDLRNALVLAGLKILADDGVQALGLREVARRVGVSAAAPYRHFPDKNALLNAMAEECFSMLRKHLEQTTAPYAQKPQQLLRAACRAYVEFAVGHPQYLRLMFGGILDKTSISPSLVTVAEDSFAALRNLVRHCQDAGVLRKGNPDQQALTIWVVEHGLAMILMEHGKLPVKSAPPDPAKLTDWLMDVVIAGLGAKS